MTLYLICCFVFTPWVFVVCNENVIRQSILSNSQKQSPPLMFLNNIWETQDYTNANISFPEFCYFFSIFDKSIINTNLGIRSDIMFKHFKHK